MRAENPTKITIAMLRNKTRFALLLLGTLCAGGALAAHAIHGKASFSGHATLTPISGNQVDLELNVAGNVTHLGKSTVRIHSLADVSGSVPQPLPPSTGVITAANGDTISFTLKWEVSEAAPGVFDVVGPLDITGGTGRFAGVSGSGEYAGRLNANTGTCAFAGSYDLSR